MTTYAAAKLHKVPGRTIRNWERDHAKICGYSGSENRRSLRVGRPESVPFANDIVMYIKDRRRLEKVFYV
jgi:hypothetical protein